MSERVGIIGSALATSLGITREQTWRAVLNGQCGITTPTEIESPLPPGADAGQAMNLPNDFAPGLPREVRYLKWTIEDAIRDAGLWKRLPRRTGVMLGTTLHGIRAAGQFLRDNNPAPLRHFLAGNTIALATSELDIRGFCATTCSACSSSLGAIALAVTLLQSHQLDLVIAGGYDTISEYAYGGFNSLRLVAPGPLLPFSRDRQGMKLAEGYGIVVLQRRDDAQESNANIHALIAGFGESADAHHLTQPHPQGRGATRAMTAALASSELSPSQIQLIAAHATATPDNDAGEYAALLATFGEELPNIPVVGFKSHLGHTLGGAGAVELILSCCALRDQRIPPCANSRKEDVEFPQLNLSVESRPAHLQNTLNTSLGFGGANTCMVLSSPSSGTPGEGRRIESSDHLIIESLATGHSMIQCSDDSMIQSKNSPKPEPPPGYPGREQEQSALHDVAITGMGIILPNAVGSDAFTQLFSRSADPENLQPNGIPESEYLHLLSARRIRRMSDYVKLSLAAAHVACRDAGVADNAEFLRDCCVLLGTTHGSSSFCSQYYRDIVAQGLPGANPTLFAEGVPNAAAAHLSLMLGIQGACQTIIGTRTAGVDALNLAALRIASGQWECALVGAAEEHSPIVDDAYRHCHLYAGEKRAGPFGEETGFITSAGSICFLLERADTAVKSKRRIHGLVRGGAAARRAPPHTGSAIESVLDQIGSPLPVLASANATWIDRAEQSALSRHWPDCVKTSVYGQIAETFSVGPLAGIAGVLLGGLKFPWPTFAALCTDYSGCVSAAVIEKSAG